MRELNYSVRGALLCNFLWRRGPPRAPGVLHKWSKSVPKVFQQCSNSVPTVIQQWSKRDPIVIYK
eukprot:8859553-Heterocapsa_arctica.AAC.1